ncbi:MAG TPA: FlgD immunoglobulin-like domain containing protein [Candidatus Eisenbacteria bacterium]
MKRFAVTLTLGLLLPPSFARGDTPAGAAGSPCSFERHIDYWTGFQPAHPCDGQPLSLVVHSCGECDHIVAGGLDGGIHLEFLSRQVCPRIPCQPESLVIPIGRLAAGNHRLLVHASARVVLDADGASCEISQVDTLDFRVGFCPPPGPLPFVTFVRIGSPALCPECPSVICPGDSFPVFVGGVFPSACYALRGIELLPSPLASPRPGPPIVKLLVAVAGQLDGPCPEMPTPFRGSVELPGLPSGPYGLIVQEAFTAWDNLRQEDSLFTAVFPFEVALRCSTGGPPPLVPLVTTIQVGKPGCRECPANACPGDSIAVLIAGTFPDECWKFEGVAVLPSDATTIVPQPPRLRANLSRNDCLDRLCAREPVPFAERLRLPPLLPGIYSLEVEEHQTILCHDPPEGSFRHAASFRVAEPCSTASGCFLLDWLHGSDRCDAYVDRQHSGQVSMTALSNTVPIAGLQGTLSFYPAGLAITDLTPVGPAANWKVAWQPTANGAKFVMFSTDATPIPETDPFVPPSPVLRVTVAIADREPTGPVTHLLASDVRASDPRGLDIPPCPTLTLVAPEARICTASASCDFNQDQWVDVRDLVLMAQCFNGSGLCPAPGSGVLDCNGDGQTTLDDLFCCAQVVLYGTITPGSPGRSEPAVQVSFGGPAATANGLDVPLRIDGVDRLGAARLALRFPSDRFDVRGVDVPAGMSEWLDLHAVDGSELRIGLIRVGTQEAARGSLPLTVHLTLRAGQTPGGELRLENGDFSGPDGVALEVNLVPTTLPIGAGSRVSLSAAQPNPFRRETRFSLTLPSAGDVELAVHDLAGRRIATLFRGRFEAGTRGFRWQGTDDGGQPVRGGVYFLRGRVAGVEVTRKVILLRGD